MFKSLLRTLPTLSGNITLTAELTQYENTSDKDVFKSHVKTGSLNPLQNDLHTKNINVSLTSGSWEYDVRKFYKSYQDVFFKDNYDEDYKYLETYKNENEIADERNKDYEWGCKRISYSLYKYQFNFYAPFYIDDINDLPDYFKITIRYSDHFKKEIKVMLNDDYKSNYLGFYLKKYINKLDSNVIFCQPFNNKAIYWGLNVDTDGGLVKYEYNDISMLYNKQNTINNFDFMICQGFMYNKLIMKQIIPLSFIFNINDFLTDDELLMLKYKSFTIYGGYYKNDVKCPLYDFDCNYDEYYPSYLGYNKYTGQYSIQADTNVMNIKYPSLNEKDFIKYSLTNKLQKRYARWILSETNINNNYNNNKYIANLSWGYSSLQDTCIRYGEFPVEFNDIFPKGYVINNDFKSPIDENIDRYYNEYIVRNYKFIRVSNNYPKYLELMNNYFSHWYNIFKSFNDIYNREDLWVDVDNSDTYSYKSLVYYNGILYNVKDKLDNTFKIDKFAVFVKPELNIVSKDDVNNVVNTKYVISNEKIVNSSYQVSDIFYDKYKNGTPQNLNFHNITDENDQTKYITNNVNFIEDNYGTFVKKNDYYLHNRYFKVSELLLGKNSKNEYIFQNYTKEIKKYISVKYEKLPLNNNINMFEFNTKTNLLQIIFYDELFDKRDNWIKEKLYISIDASGKKYRLVDFGSKYFFNWDEKTTPKYTLYQKDTFISYTDLIKAIFDKYDINKDGTIDVNDIDAIISIMASGYTPETFFKLLEEYDINNDEQININDVINIINIMTELNTLLESVNEYNYIPYLKDNGTVMYDYVERCIFQVKDKTIEYNDLTKYKNDYIYVDYNNLVKYIKDIYKYDKNDYNDFSLFDILNRYNNETYNSELSKDDLNKLIKTFHARFINKYHIEEYIKHICKLPKEWISKIYVKRRFLIKNNTSHTFEIKDKYTLLTSYLTLNKILKEDTDEFNAFVSNKNYFLSTISDTREDNDKFTLNINGHILHLDLCFKQEFIKLTSDLYNVITYKYEHMKKLSKERLSDINFMYLFRQDPCIDDYRSTLYQSNNINNSWIYNKTEKILDDLYVYDERFKNMLTRLNYVNIEEYLVPLFDSIYVTDNDRLELYNLLTSNKILTNDISLSLYEKYDEDGNIIDYNETVMKTYSYNNDIYPFMYELEDLVVWIIQQYHKYFVKKYISTIERISSDERIISIISSLIISYFTGDYIIYETIKEVQDHVLYDLDIHDESDEDQDEAEDFTSDLYAFAYFITHNLYNEENELINTYYFINQIFEYNQSIVYDYVIPDLISRTGNHLYSIYDNPSVDEYIVDEDNYNQNLKINYFTKNGLTYGYYVIKVNFDNSNISFNLNNDEKYNITFKDIDSHKIIDNNKVVYNTIYKYFKILDPFLKIDIFDEASKYILNETLMTPNKFYLKTRFCFNEIDNDIYEVDEYKQREMELIRYFGHITPNFNIIDSCIDNLWGISFKENTIIDNDDMVINKVNNGNINKCNDSIIYKKSIVVEAKKRYGRPNKLTNNIVINTDYFKHHEYKHFNDNKIYNLEESFILYNDIEFIKYSELVNQQKIEIIYEYFKKYLKKIQIKHQLDLFDENTMLFLFKRYNITCVSNTVKTLLNISNDINDNDKLYKLEYHFNLK